LHLRILAAGLLLATALPAQTLYGLFGLDGAADGRRQLGTVADTGSVTLLGAPVANDTLATTAAHVAYDFRADAVYALGRDSSGASRVYTIAIGTGVATSVPLSAGSIDRIVGLHYDRRGRELFVIGDVGGGGAAPDDKRLYGLDPATGTITARGAGAAGVDLATPHGVLVGNDDQGEIYFVGRPAGGVDSVYTVDTTSGAIAAVPLVGAAVNEIVALEYDDFEATVYALLVRPNGTRRLATIDPGTGIATLVGSGPLAGGAAIRTMQGVAALDAGRDRFVFVGDAGAGWELFDVDTATGTATSTVLDESTFRSGGYVGLEFTTAAECIVRNGTGINPVDLLCETPPSIGAVWHFRLRTDPATLANFIIAGTPIPIFPIFGGELLLEPLLVLPIALSGEQGFLLPVDGLPGTLYIQGLRIDTGAIVLTNALEVRVDY
jgi:hypothetical protein